MTLAPACYSRLPGVAISRNGRVVAFLAGRTVPEARKELGLPLAPFLLSLVRDHGPIHVAEVAKRADADVRTVNATLGTLALRGKVRRVAPATYTSLEAPHA